jgi:hypothetical protein
VRVNVKEHGLFLNVKGRRWFHPWGGSHGREDEEGIQWGGIESLISKMGVFLNLHEKRGEDIMDLEFVMGRILKLNNYW